jgi:hypothetical protein
MLARMSDGFCQVVAQPIRRTPKALLTGSGRPAACRGYWVSPGRLRSAPCPFGTWPAAGRATRSAGTVTCGCRGRSIYYRASDGTVPALEFLDACPGAIDAQFTAVLDAVVAAPPVAGAHPTEPGRAACACWSVSIKWGRPSTAQANRVVAMRPGDGA